MIVNYKIIRQRIRVTNCVVTYGRWCLWPVEQVTVTQNLELPIYIL